MRFFEIFGVRSHMIPGNPGVREGRKGNATDLRARNRGHSNRWEGSPFCQSGIRRTQYATTCRNALQITSDVIRESGNVAGKVLKR